MPQQKIYRFKGIEDLHADENGNFFFRNKRAKKIVNNGSLAVLAGRTKYGIKKLRTLAYKTSVQVEECPF